MMLGAGHVDWKIMVDTRAFISATKADALDLD